MERREPLRIPIYKYSIMTDGKVREKNLLGFRTALAHARRYANNMFEQNRKIEILNTETAEIVTLNEAEQKAKKYNSMRSR